MKQIIRLIVASAACIINSTFTIEEFLSQSIPMANALDKFQTTSTEFIQGPRDWAANNNQGTKFALERALVFISSEILRLKEHNQRNVKNIVIRNINELFNILQTEIVKPEYAGESEIKKYFNFLRELFTSFVEFANYIDDIVEKLNAGEITSSYSADKISKIVSLFIKDALTRCVEHAPSEFLYHRRCWGTLFDVMKDIERNYLVRVNPNYVHQELKLLLQDENTVLGPDIKLRRCIRSLRRFKQEADFQKFSWARKNSFKGLDEYKTGFIDALKAKCEENKENYRYMLYNHLIGGLEAEWNRFYTKLKGEFGLCSVLSVRIGSIANR